MPPIKLLLVQKDEDEARRLFEIMKEDEIDSYKVDHVLDPNKAIQKIKNEKYDVLLLDLQSDEDIGLFSQVNDLVSELPILVLIEPEQEKAAIEAIRRGAQDFIQKDSLDAKELARIIRHSIERKHFEETQQKLLIELSKANESLQREMKQRRRAEQEMIQISERERIRLSQDLHDGISQELAGIAYLCKTLETSVAKKSPKDALRLEEIIQLVTKIMRDIKNLCRGLHPLELEQQGLASALQEMALTTENLYAVTCRVQTDGNNAIPDQTVQTHLYRIAQEAVHNAIKHGRAKTIQILFVQNDDHVRLSIKNDGLPFEERDRDEVKGMGLRNMAYRAEMISAKLVVRRSESEGTEVAVTVPVHAEQKAWPSTSSEMIPNEKITENDGGAQHATKRTRIVIVDDHPIVRKGIAQLINQEKDLIVMGEADDVAQAIEVISAIQPDMVIVDISLKSSNGIELIKVMNVRNPQLPILVISMHDENLYAETVLQAGAHGYVIKHEAAEKVVMAVRKILRGEYYVSGRLGPSIVEKFKLSQPVSS